jgi:hypothetical protein
MIVDNLKTVSEDAVGYLSRNVEMDGLNLAATVRTVNPVVDSAGRITVSFRNEGAYKNAEVLNNTIIPALEKLMGKSKSEIANFLLRGVEEKKESK